MPWRNAVMAAPGMAQENLAVAGDPDAAAVALEERRRPTLAFHFTDCFGDSRLADMQNSCCLHHALLARDFQKGLQVAELDAAVDHGIS